MITSCIPALIIPLHVLVFLHPSLLPSCFPLLTVAVTRLRSDLLGKPRPVCPYERKSHEAAEGGRSERWIVKRRRRTKKGRRADDEDVLHAGCVSPSCFLSPWRAVLVSDFERSRFTEQGGKTCGRIKGNFVEAKCAKTLARNGLWVMKKSPRMHCKSREFHGQQSISHW